MITMVDSQQTVVARMVLPLPTSTATKRDRTGYQLEPNAMHVNHHGILPAAALSNFFKAPATPIRNKLPSITISDGNPLRRTKSIHQRNKCLAEVIQSQLLDLKRLQDRYRNQKADCRKSSQLKSSVEDVGTIPTKTHTSNSNPKQKMDEIHKLLTPNVKLVPKRPSIKPTSLVRQSAPITPAVETSQKTVKVTTITAKAPTKLTADPTSLAKDSRVQEIKEFDETSTRNYYMDAAKLASISEWVNSVEIAQRLEGKCSEVISTPLS